MKFLRKHSLFTALLLLPALLASLVLSLPVLAAGQKTEGLELYARSAVLMDASSGRILYEKDARQILPMASTTKIMTCILALEYGNPEDYAVASAYAASMPKVKLNASKDEIFLLKDLLYSLMLESHNDAAVILAEHICGSTEAFATLMNQKARDIGCFDTYFITPNGLDAVTTDAQGRQKTHSTTAADLARMMSYCILDSPKKEEFLTITRTASYSFGSYQEKDGAILPSGRTYSCTNHNAFLGMMDGALSGKTGFTGNAGYCYVGALQQEERTFVVALLACGWPNNKTYKWSDTKKLMRYGLENYHVHSLSEAAYPEESLTPIPVKNGQTKALGAIAYTGLSVKQSQADTKGNRPIDTILLAEDEQIQTKCQIEKELTAPVLAGTPVGSIQYLVDGQVYKMESIVTTDTIPAIDYSWCLMQILFRFIP